MKTTRFNELYSQYRTASLSDGVRPELYKLMVKCAKSFDDWTIIHRYGDGSYQSLAQEKMKAIIFNEKTALDVQRNIINLFELIVDDDERREIMEDFISKYQSVDDYLFAMVITPTVVSYFPGMGKMTIKEIDKVLSNKRGQLQKMLEMED